MDKYLYSNSNPGASYVISLLRAASQLLPKI